MRAVDVATRSLLLLTPLPLEAMAFVNLIVRGRGPELPVPLVAQVRREPVGRHVGAPEPLPVPFRRSPSLDRGRGVRQETTREAPYLSRAAFEGVGASASRVRHNLRRR